MSRIAKSDLPFPKNEDELVNAVREIVKTYDWTEIFITKGDKISFSFRDDQGDRAIELTPYDLVRSSEMIEVIPKTSDPLGVLFTLFEEVERSRAWPYCFIVESYPQFGSWLGLDAVRMRSRRVLGYPVLQDSRAPENVIILAAAPSFKADVWSVNFSVFTHYEEDRE